MPTLHFIICNAIILASISAFIILLIGKLGIRNIVIMKAPRLISQLFSCDFCLSFWTSFILAIILAIISNEMSVIYISIVSTPITRILI